MMQSSALIFAVLLRCCAGLRKSGRRQQLRVDGLFPMGSPGSATPPLHNHGGSTKCFPGARFWTEKKKLLVNRADMVTTMAGPLGYRHPEMDAVAIDMNKWTTNVFPCEAPDSETPNQPRGLPRVIHDWEFYVQGASAMGDLYHNVSHMGIAQSFTYDREVVSNNVAAGGWKLIGSAIDQGGAIYVGKQVSHLVQQPETGACIITFQGSSSAQDWLANANAKKSSYCGLVAEGRECKGPKCDGTPEGESFVHAGFRDALRAIVENDDFQSDIVPKLHQCSKLYVTGHSLGGAQAELFAACVQKAPQQGEHGYDDYKNIVG